MGQVGAVFALEVSRLARSNLDWHRLLELCALTETLTDAWATTAAKTGPRGTFHGFKGQPGQARIDWILFRGLARATQVETITKNTGGRYPSDHFPVFAELEF